jgi:hypothetical protein
MWSHFDPHHRKIETLAKAGLHHSQIHQALQLPGTPAKLLEWCKKNRIEVYSKKRSAFDPWHNQIAATASIGLDSVQIHALLDLPLHPKQLQKYMRQHGIQLQTTRGARPAERNPNWRGGVSHDGGYRSLRRPDHPSATKAGYVREHRLVMEEYLGRYLEPHEVVHHANGDRHDNRIENLELFSSNGEHLAETRAGQIPNWTESGRQKLRRAIARRTKDGVINLQAYTTRPESESDAQECP